MWIKEVRIKTNANREQVWKLWADVENWNKWDHEVENASLDGGFVTGNIGIVKPTNGPKSKFELTSVIRLQEFTSQSSLPFTKMEFIHEMEEVDGELFITHKVKIKGLLTFLFSRVIGEKVIKELPKALENLSRMALEN